MSDNGQELKIYDAEWYADRNTKHHFMLTGTSWKDAKNKILHKYGLGLNDADQQSLMKDLRLVDEYEITTDDIFLHYFEPPLL